MFAAHAKPVCHINADEFGLLTHHEERNYSDHELPSPPPLSWEGRRYRHMSRWQMTTRIRQWHIRCDSLFIPNQTACSTD